MAHERVALVTGAARGQGLAVVRRLRRDGVAVAAGDVLVEDLHRAVAALDDPDVLPLELDVADEASWAAALDEVVRRFGRLDVLVNNAGILHRSKLLSESAADFERLWRVNCLGPFLGMRAAAPLLAQGDHPAIVNTLSNAALKPFPGHGSYTSSKWAARGLTLTAALELAEHGIRVNAVLPGPVATPMHDPATIERLASAPLVGRAGTPEDIAEIVAFLASPASAFMTGSEVVADGGQLLKPS